MGKQGISALTRLVALTAFEADRNMLCLDVLVEDVDGAGEGAVQALPAAARLRHPRPDKAICILIGFVPEKACSKSSHKGDTD